MQARPSHRAFVALGANLGDPAAQLRSALEQLKTTPGLRLRRVSSFYRSLPLGPPGQRDYCNAVCELTSELSAPALLALLQSIEAGAGRTRGERWGPRVLDLDLLLFDGVSSATPQLSLPHPHLHERAFVLIPLAEIAPDLPIPGRSTVRELASAMNRSTLKPWA